MRTAVIGLLVLLVFLVAVILLIRFHTYLTGGVPPSEGEKLLYGALLLLSAGGILASTVAILIAVFGKIYRRLITSFAYLRRF